MTEEKLRRDCPAMFTHPDLRPGEVWIGDYVIDVAGMNAQIYRRHGCPGTRLGTKNVMITLRGRENGGPPKDMQFEGRSIFMKLDELIAAEAKLAL